MWNLKTLKQQTYDLWGALHVIHNAHYVYSTPTTDQSFKREIRSYGDLRTAQTWRRAYAVLKARFLADVSSDDGQFLIESHLIKSPKREGWEDLVSLVVAELLAIPSAAEALTNGFAALIQYGRSYGTTHPEIEELWNATKDTIERLDGRRGQPLSPHAPRASLTAAAR